MKLPLLPIILLFVPAAFSSPKSITLDEFLLEAKKSERVSSYRKNQMAQEDSIGRQSVNSPFRSVQVRHTINPVDKEYALRLIPFGIGEQSAEKNLADARLDVLQEQVGVEIARELRNRYNSILLLDHKRRARNFTSKLQKILTYASSVHRQSLRSKKVDIGKLMMVDMQISKNRRQLDMLNSEIRNVEAEIFIKTDGRALSNSLKLIEVAEIRGSIAKRKTDIQSTLHIQLADKKLKSDKAELEFVRTRDWRLLDFFEVKVNRKATRDDYSFGLAINLPFFMDSREDLDARRISVIIREGSLLSKIKRLKIELYQLSKNVLLAVSEHEKHQGSNQIGKLKRYKKIFSQVKGVDPLDLLSIEEQIIRTELDLLESLFRARKLFIKFLFLIGDLNLNPFVNYLKHERSSGK